MDGFFALCWCSAIAVAHTYADMTFAAQRGAHTFFLRMGKVPRWGGYTVNLIHYEDAAGLAAAVSMSLPQTWIAMSFSRSKALAATALYMVAGTDSPTVEPVTSMLPQGCLHSSCAATAVWRSEGDWLWHLTQVLRGDGSQQPYRGRVFLGADGVPVTFQVSQGPPVNASGLRKCQELPQPITQLIV